LTGRAVDRDALAELRRRRFYERIEGTGPIAGVEEALAAARALGLKVGLASSGSHEWVHGQLTRLGLIERFDCIRTREDVRHAKPDPELYRAVVECLGVAPREAVAFEDSPNGALAARRAGLYCVVVPNSITAGLEFGEHDLRLESLARTDLAELLARLVVDSAAADPV
ncbi:MAG TPA: HAD-IA family hydrolase, partial [Longimicrobium sp.]|nr:HAD-IA family hydrolase [Longimicrobium sp.]